MDSMTDRPVPSASEGSLIGDDRAPLLPPGPPLPRAIQGAAFGIVVYVAFHVVLMPLMGTVPAPWDQPFAEHFSEFFGHIIWLWVIEVFRRDMRNRITHEPDAEFPLETRTN